MSFHKLLRATTVNPIKEVCDFKHKFARSLNYLVPAPCHVLFHVEIYLNIKLLELTICTKSLFFITVELTQISDIYIQFENVNDVNYLRPSSSQKSAK